MQHFETGNATEGLRYDRTRGLIFYELKAFIMRIFAQGMSVYAVGVLMYKRMELSPQEVFKKKHPVSI
jgi:hypothetical protein